MADVNPEGMKIGNFTIGKFIAGGLYRYIIYA
jgi:hypothetical protein